MTKKNYQSKNNAIQIFGKKIWADGKPYCVLEEEPIINKEYILKDKGVSMRITSMKGSYGRATFTHLTNKEVLR